MNFPFHTKRYSHRGDLDNSVRDLRDALRLCPTDRRIQKELKVAEREMRQIRKRQKESMRNALFSQKDRAKKTRKTRRKQGENKEAANQGGLEERRGPGEGKGGVFGSGGLGLYDDKKDADGEPSLFPVEAIPEPLRESLYLYLYSAYSFLYSILPSPSHASALVLSPLHGISSTLKFLRDQIVSLLGLMWMVVCVILGGKDETRVKIRGNGGNEGNRGKEGGKEQVEKQNKKEI